VERLQGRSNVPRSREPLSRLWNSEVVLEAQARKRYEALLISRAGVLRQPATLFDMSNRNEHLLGI
jgi:hypothetical protein